MSTNRHINKICVAAILISLVLTFLFMGGVSCGVVSAGSGSIMGYEDRLFDTSSVHTIDIVMDDWDSFIDTCESEEYSSCAVVIDGESYRNIGIWAKGNTSLSSVRSMKQRGTFHKARGRRKRRLSGFFRHAAGNVSLEKYQLRRGGRKPYKFAVTLTWHFCNSPFWRIICGDKGQELRQYVLT